MNWYDQYVSNKKRKIKSLILTSLHNFHKNEYKNLGRTSQVVMYC